MKFDVLTLFPDMVAGPLNDSIIGRGIERGLIELNLWNIRDYAVDRHRTVDDSPYGGGAGMVMKVEPLYSCIETVKAKRPEARVILTSPRGVPFSQEMAKELAGLTELIIVCGRYEGIDERVTELCIDQEVSIGDFVLTGGELAAMVIVDAVGRLLPGVLGCDDSSVEESFSDGLLEYPQYTRPPEFHGLKVPEVLLSGNHQEIAKWRRQQAILRTVAARPELLANAQLTPAERTLVAHALEMRHEH
ncbi:tRNA (guanosine(37)-N1)-methyltransferase TrmD [Geobacter pelophilus]|uniref:tRNA (guanine-N(1)-)-methyltransferase n=1 Tax=Geoanaerobacter pelophilus TaxID=60036 RepID=A0AAW4L152_9BACT|nr:tRNA (guanosine(37)-N1)-methyltransferase TrmD [Geoanaerobacter pelophilus]MBT0663215.1 tRNA (guanosine(37)-N1)-methyltransferase TrmD [Geoanaerobacter pelophilus]